MNIFKAFQPILPAAAREMGAQNISTKWEKTCKKDGATGLWNVKARFCAREFRWKELRDDLYCPDASFSTGRLVDFVAQKMVWCTFVLDGTSAFLHCPGPDNVTVTPSISEGVARGREGGRHIRESNSSA